MKTIIERITDFLEGRPITSEATGMFIERDDLRKIVESSRTLDPLPRYATGGMVTGLERGPELVNPRTPTSPERQPSSTQVLADEIYATLMKSVRRKEEGLESLTAALALSSGLEELIKSSRQMTTCRLRPAEFKRESPHGYDELPFKPSFLERI